MTTRKNIDTVLTSFVADKLSRRERDWIKLMKPPPAMVASTILGHRHDAGFSPGYRKLGINLHCASWFLARSKSCSLLISAGPLFSTPAGYVMSKWKPSQKCWSAARHITGVKCVVAH